MKKVIIMLAFAYCGCDRFPKSENFDRSRILKDFRYYTENNLRYPGNAQFIEYEIGKVKDSVYLVIVDIDAANGFGARSRLRCAGKIEYNRDGPYISRVTVENLSLK